MSTMIKILQSDRVFFIHIYFSIFSSFAESIFYESANDIHGVLAFTLQCGSVCLVALRS